MEWFEMELAVPHEAADAVSEELLAIGAGGVTEDLNRMTARVTLKAYFPTQLGQSETLQKIHAYLKKIKKHFPEIKDVEATTRWVEDENWVERYKEFFKAGPISKTFFLKPVWDKTTQTPPGMMPILMEPGQAFGTGLHPSTKLAIRALEQVLDLYPSREKLRLMDVGTGTGIIAMAAEKLGLKKITAIDVDVTAVKVARENLELNGCSQVSVSSKPLNEFKKPFDLMVSNILLETHRHLARQYSRLVVPGGILILSGLLGSQRADIHPLMRKAGMDRLFEYSLQEWSAFAFVSRESYTSHQ